MDTIPEIAATLRNAADALETKFHIDTQIDVGFSWNKECLRIYAIYDDGAELREAVVGQIFSWDELCEEFSDWPVDSEHKKFLEGIRDEMRRQAARIDLILAEQY